MSLAHGKPQTEEQITTTVQEDEEGQYQKVLDEALPEIGQFSPIAIFLASLGYNATNQRLNIREAIRPFTDPKFAENILKAVESPEEFAKYLNNYSVAKQEVERQKKEAVKRKSSRDYAQVGIGKSAVRIGFEDFSHKQQGVIVVHALHQHINETETKLKVDRTITTFGITDKGMQGKLRGGMKIWLETHKGRTVDDYLTIFGRRFALEQRVEGEPTEKKIKEVEKKQRVELERKKEILGEQLKTARKDALEQSQSVIDRTRVELSSLLDPSKPCLSSEDLDERIRSMLLGKPLPKTQTESQTVSSLKTIIADSPQTSKQAPVNPPLKLQQASRLPTLSRFHLFNFRSRLSSLPLFSGLRRMVSRFQSFTSGVLSGLGSFGKNIISSGLRKLGLGGGGLGNLTGSLLKQAASALFGAATGGLGKLANLALSAFGLDITKLFIIFVGVLILFFFLLDALLPIPHFGVQDALTAKSVIVLTWKNFEKNYIANSYEKKVLGEWNKFELDMFSSLFPLHAYRHNNVQK